MCLFLFWPLLPMVQWKMGCLPRPHLVAFYKQYLGVAMFHQLPSLPSLRELRWRNVAPSKMFAHRLRWPNSPQVRDNQSGWQGMRRLHVTCRICLLGNFRMGFCSSCQRLDTSALENLAFCIIFNVFSSGFNIVLSSLHVMDSGMTLEVGDSESVCKCRQKWVVLYIYVVFFNHGSRTKLAPRKVSFVLVLCSFHPNMWVGGSQHLHSHHHHHHHYPIDSMQTRGQKHNPGSLWTGNPEMSNTVFWMHGVDADVSGRFCHPRSQMQDSKQQRHQRWQIVLRSITIMTCEYFGIKVYSHHYPSSQWRCMPNMFKSEKQRALEMVQYWEKHTCILLHFTPHNSRCFRAAIGRYKKS